jgi:hypothetical protein
VVRDRGRERSNPLAQGNSFALAMVRADRIGQHEQSACTRGVKLGLGQMTVNSEQLSF